MSDPSALEHDAIRAATAKNWHEAEYLWREYVIKFPNMANGRAQLVGSLRELGRYDEAEEVLATALTDFPNDQDIAFQNACMAHSRLDWAEAVRRWASYMKRFIPHPDAIVVQGMALWNFQLQNGATAEPIGHDQEVAELFLRFESLGNNCEFGFVQRHFGAEPLGLLRWSFIEPELLTHALETRFAGVGERECTYLKVIDGEYSTGDTRFDMGMHTYIKKLSVKDHDAFFEQQLKRVQFLRQKLLEDLDIGEKIFVYKGSRRMVWADIQKLYGAFHRQTKATLFCVIDKPDCVGAVVRPGDRILIGCLAQILDDAEGHRTDYDTWSKLCRQAAALV